MSKRKLSLRRLFSNNKFLAAFSLLVAIIFWIVVALEYAPIVENVIKNVPVNIDMENSVPDKLGLQIFGQSDYKVDVTIKGNRYVIGGSLVTADDIDVSAQTAYVNSAGNHTLQLKVTAKDANANFEIVELSSEYIEVYFDNYEEKEFEVTPKIITNLKNITEDEYLFYESDIILGTQTVTLSGPKTEMDKIQAVYANIEVKSKLNESMTYDSKLSIDNGSQEEAQYISINGEPELTVPVTLPVYQVVTLPVSVSFKNTPVEYINKPLKYTCTPSSAKVGIIVNGSDNGNTVDVGTVDFAKITSKNNSFSFSASNIKDVKVLDNIDKFTVTVNANNVSDTSLSLNKDNVSISGLASGKTATIDLSSTGEISVSGNKSSITSVNDSNLVGVINLKNVELKDGRNKVKLNLSLKDKTDCWVTGTYYAYIAVK